MYICPLCLMKHLETFSKIKLVAGNFLPSISILTLCTSKDQIPEHLERVLDTHKSSLRAP